MKKIDIKFIVESAIIAALYAALTWAFAPISYDAIQFRISEVLVLIVIFNRKYAFALILGCFIANITSSLGWYDMVFGTLATTIAIIPMLFVKKIYISAIFPVLANMFIVPLELALAFGSEMLEPAVFWYNVATVGFGEAVVLYFIGIPLMISISKDEALTELLSFDTSNMSFKNKFFTFGNMLAIALTALGVVLFFAYPMYKEFTGESYNRSAFYAVTIGHYYLISFVVCEALYAINYLFVKDIKYKTIINIVISICIIALAIVLGINFNTSFRFVYFYVFFIYPLLLIASTFIEMLRANRRASEEKILEESEM
ncbi:MAG: QueT transporter family protein [Acholeplasmatales bacterium]|nr:QueT transporter family protein [Acholeplasmatales bacterium]